MIEHADDAEAVFFAALERGTAPERAAYVEGACVGRPELLQRVRELIQSHEESRGPLDAPPPGLGATVSVAPLTERPGMKVGPYKLLQQIGEGGMGVVYMAEQEEPVRRKVALKIIKPGMDSAQVIARFEAERQALSLMDHPNIARVLDAGTTETGRPYFVMELVHGVPVTNFCDDHKLTPRERLALFVPVCQAIQHAHQKGIIHRDLKPSNVLVTLYDDKPVPKVIDFGVAKAVEQRLTERTLFTQFGALVGTFEYMSPEQAEMNALGVDTRSDIYSLGVLLYELLTGTTPLEKVRLRQAALDELVRLIKEEEPPRPSARLSSSGNLPKIAAARKTEPAKLSKLVRGEIDWIVMKCLEKDRARRYETANGLARDVERYLKDEPVEACPPSAGYRLRKLLRKHRTAALTTAAIVLASVVAVVGQTINIVRAQNAEAEANRQRAAAVESEQQAQRERDDARDARESLRQTLYASNMQLAQAAWEANNVTQVLDLLKRERPGPGEDDLRGFEWHYWQRQCRTEIRSVRFPVPLGFFASLSPDGQRFVYPLRKEMSGGKDLTIRTWDTDTARELASVVPFPGEGLSTFGRPVFSADGRYLALAAGRLAGRRDGRLKVWDSRTGHDVLNLKGLRSLPRGPALDGTGKRLATAWPAADDQRKDWEVTIWDVGTGKELRTLPLRSGNEILVVGLAFTPDGTRLAAQTIPQEIRTGVRGTEVRVWDTATGKELFCRKGFSGGTLAFSPDGRSLAAGMGEEVGRPAVVNLWDGTTGEERLTLTGLTGRLRCLAFSADGARLAAGGGDGVVRIWDLAGRNAPGVVAPERTWRGYSTPLVGVAFSGDGRLLFAAGGDGVVKVWDTTARAEPLTQTVPGSQLTATAATATATHFAALWEPSRGNHVVKVWDRTGRVLFTTKYTRPNVRFDYEREAKLSPDGARLALSMNDEVADGGREKPAGAVRVWDVLTGKELFRLDSDTGPIHVHDFSPDGRRLLTTHKRFSREVRDELGQLKVWDVTAGKELQSFAVPGFASAAFSPDGRRVAARIYSQRPDKRDGELRVWDAETGQELLRRKGPHGHGWTLAWNSDGTLLATAVGTLNGPFEVVVLDAATGRERFALTGHRGQVAQLLFSPDGRRLVSAGSSPGIPGGEVKVWETTSGRELLTLPIKGHGFLASPAFSRDGHRLFVLDGNSLGQDVEVRVWDATPLPEEAGGR
jgi:WD40 repeat protein/serine/threonine protein kinase